MAELVLSPLIELLFEKLTDAALKTIARHKGIDAEIKKWQKSLLSIQLYLTHASQMEITDPSVKQRANDLQHLAYDIDDVLDGWLTEAMHPEFPPESEGITSKVRKLLPTCCTNFSQIAAVIAELDDISNQLQDLVKQKIDLGLIMKEDQSRPNNNNNNRSSQTSIVNPSSIFGRQAEKEALVQQLLSPVDEPCDQNYGIVPIVGMGGVGKTTLAGLVYHEKQVIDHFEPKAWVCVSDKFDTFAISKVFFQYVAGVNKEFANLNMLQEDLVNHLRGKRFLLVLDDVWSENYMDWETLVKPFHTCAQGSKIIITTRKFQLVNQLVHNPLNKQLLKLSDDDALSLVARHALGVNNFDSHLSLKPYAKGIVKKCGGLPLALVALGRLLRTKQDEVEHWKKVSNSDIWRLKDEGGMLPALRISYDDLSAPLKKVFAYCSLFPKDFMFDKEELVLLWMAEGFLHQLTQIDSTEELQRLGHKFFDELLSRSFFQHAPNDESLFVMHDLMNDLATSVAGEFFVRLDSENEKNIRTEMLENYHHLSFVRERYVAYKKFEAFTKARRLRTFLATSAGEVKSWNGYMSHLTSAGYIKSCYAFYLSNKILTDLLPTLPSLRVLYLSHFSISEVPESIGTLRHLRYLNLSQTRITHLPETVCNLRNLQTLLLFGCYALTKLPNNFLKLKNLRHLDVRDTPLLFKMLSGVGDLKSLQITLSKIVIGCESGFEIAKLKYFKNLCGKISIIGLEKVQNAIHAQEANFSQKRLSELELVWSDELHDSRNQMLQKAVLNELKPCDARLIQLKIRAYGGLDFPNWVGHPSFLSLKHVSITKCRRCTSLPPLAQLPSLKELFIADLYAVEVVDFELSGTGHAFPSLEIMSFKDMHGWKKWSGAVFPRLQKLTIDGCRNLVEITLETQPSLNDLTLKACDSVVLRRLVEVAPAVTKLEIRSISRLNDVAWGAVLEYLGSIEELSAEYCNEIRYLVKSDADASMVLVKLRKLEVGYCDKLVSIAEKEEDNCRSNLLPALRTLEVYNCKNMECCSCPDGIEKLSVKSCSSITVVSFPKGGQEKLKSVIIGNCIKLSERELGGQRMEHRSSMPMLEYVDIRDWANLKSISELSHLTSLKKLYIENCHKMDGSFLGDNLTLLETLMILNCQGMDVSIPGWVWPPNLRELVLGKLKRSFSEWGEQNFPTSLVKLELHGDGEDGVDSCSQISHILPSSLTSLDIMEFKKLESVSMGLQHLTSLQHLFIYNCPDLKEVFSHPQNLTSLQSLSFSFCHNLKEVSLDPQHLTSLQHLSFNYCHNLKEVSLDPQHLTSLHHLTFYECPNMKDLPESLLPSLLRLDIKWSPGLRERCSKNGSYWPLISHIPCIEM